MTKEYVGLFDQVSPILAKTFADKRWLQQNPIKIHLNHFSILWCHQRVIHFATKNNFDIFA